MAITPYRVAESLGQLNANESTAVFRCGDYMSPHSRVLSIVGNEAASGAATVTVHFFQDSAGSVGGASEVTMVTATGYVRHIEVNPDLYFRLVMTGRTTDDFTFYA